jgi:nucleoside-diphosphate-sugar epimerase
MSGLNADNWRRLHGSFFQGQRVLITGGAGFIGSHLADALLALGAQVVVLDDLSAGRRENLQNDPSLTFVQGSILDRDLLRASVAGCGYVFHEAALGSVPRSVELPLLYNEVNATGTLNVLEAARHLGVKRVIFAARSSAYGFNAVPWVETMPVLPRSPYAATKVAGEALLRAYSGSYGLDTAALRYFNIFGPRQSPHSAYAAVIAAFAKAYLNGRPPVIYGDGEHSRDFTFVANAVHANLLAARKPGRIGGEVMNVGCGGRISLNRLANQMGVELGRPDLLPVYEPERAGDIRHSYADLTRVRAMLGYEPVVAFREGLRETLGWYRSILEVPRAIAG